MSLLTKVFVVLVAILSVVLVAMMVPFVANTQNYKGQIQDMQLQVAAANANAALRQSELSRTTDQFTIERRALQDQASDAKSRLDGVLQQLAATEQDFRTAQAEIGRLTAANAQHAAAATQATDLIRQLNDEVQLRRRENTELSTRMIQLSDRNTELEEQSRTLDRQVRRLQEQLTAVTAELQGLQAQATTGGGTAADAATPGSPTENRGFEAPEGQPVQGQVTRVESLDGETLVQINVGQNDGVQENMRFLVARGDQYVGTLVVSMVDTKSAAGRMRLEQGTVQVGDTVISGRY